MNDPCMQKDWHNEPPPLIRLLSVCLPTILDWDLAPAKPTPIRERTTSGRCRCVWARVGQAGLIGHTLDDLHTGDEARTHVDEYVGGRADHGIDLGFDGYGGACENGIARDFGDEDGDLNGGENPANPGSAAIRFKERHRPRLLLWGFGVHVAELASFRSGDVVLGTSVVERDPVVVRLMLVVVVAVGNAMGGPARVGVVGRIDVYGLCGVVAAEEAIVVAGNAVGGRK